MSVKHKVNRPVKTPAPNFHRLSHDSKYEPITNVKQDNTKLDSEIISILGVSQEFYQYQTRVSSRVCSGKFHQLCF